MRKVNTFSALLLLLFSFLFFNKGYGQAASATWSLTSNANAVVSGNVTAGAATGGSAVTGWPTTSSCGSYCSNMSLASFSTGANQYVQFTISPTSGNVLTVNTLLLHTNATSSSGTCCPVGCDIAAYYSLDGFATAGTLFTGTLGTTGDDGNCTLSQQDSYSVGGVSVPNGGTMTIRVYAFAMNVNTDRFYIGNVVISGTTTSSCSAPTITSFSPASACSGSGSTITINGANYTSCSPITSSSTFTVNTAPATPGAISGSANICGGRLDTFSVAAVSGAASYTWSRPGGWTGSSTTNSITATTNSTSGIVSVTAGNICGNSAAQVFTVNAVSGVPAMPGSISGTAAVCSGARDTFSVAAVSGATSYTWSLPSGWSGTSTTNSINSTAGSTGGTVSVTANNVCGSSAAQTFTVATTSAPATPAVIFGRATECSGALDSFGVVAVSGATSYTWSLPSGWVGASSINAITGTAGSSGTVSVTANNACGSSAAQTFAVTVSSPPATPGAVSGRATVCSGSLDTLSIAAVSGATSYTWSLPGGWTGTSATNSIVATAGASGGIVSVTANNNCGSSAAQVFTTVVTTAPATPGAISGRATVCSGNLDTFSIAAVNGATSYTWSLPSGWSGTSTTNSIIATAGATGGTVSVTAHNSCGTSSAQIFTVAVSAPAPATPGVVSGRALLCSGGRDTLSIAAVSGATSYTWSLPGGWTGTSTTASIIATTGSTGGTVSVTANNSCGSSAAQTYTVTINTAPATPGAISGRNGLCTGNLDTFSIAAVSGTTSYTWTLPSGWSGTSTTTSIIATAGPAGGAVTVTANNACGSSSPQTFAVTLGSSPAMPGSITGRAIVCAGSRDTFSIAAVSGATSYTWSLPSGWSGTSTTTSIIATTSSTGGIVSVTANSCGSSAPQVFTVVVNTTPATPGVISGRTTLCGSGRYTFSISPVNGATSYTWSLPSGWAGTSTTTNIIATTNSTGGTVSVTANGTCGSSAASILAVTINSAPATPGPITGHSGVCGGSTDTFIVSPVAGATSYVWTLPNGWSGTSTTNAIVVTAGSAGGAITVAARNACGTSSPQTKVDTILATPQVTFNITSGPVCITKNPSITLSGTPSGGSFSGSGVTGNVFNASTLTAGTYELFYTVTNGVGCTGLDTALVIVTTCTGIDDVNTDRISIYPNPFTDEITIHTDGTIGSSTVLIFDAMGREIKRQDFTGVNIQLNTGSFASGPYMISILADGRQIAVKKLFKME